MTHDWWYVLPLCFVLFYILLLFGGMFFLFVLYVLWCGHRAPLQLDLVHLVCWARLRIEQEQFLVRCKSTIRNGSSSLPARRPPTREPLAPALLNTNFNSPGHLRASRTLVTHHLPLATAAGCQNLSTVSWTTRTVVPHLILIHFQKDVCSKYVVLSDEYYWETTGWNWKKRKKKTSC